MTPYKSMLKGVCDRIGRRYPWCKRHAHPFYGAVCYLDFYHLFAPVCHDALSRDAWHLERSSPAYPVLAGVHMQALFPGQKTWKNWRVTPASVTAWRFRRLLKASYWRIHLLVTWWAEEALHALPPRDGTIHLVGDGREKPQRGTRNPLAQKGRKSEHHPWFFGIRFALLIATGCLSPARGISLIRPKNHPAYQTENALFRAMVVAFTPPVWATTVIVEGDAAYGSQENIKMVKQRAADDPTRRWGFVFALARTWKTVEDKALKDLVTHLPRKYYQRVRCPPSRYKGLRLLLGLFTPVSAASSVTSRWF